MPGHRRLPLLLLLLLLLLPLVLAVGGCMRSTEPDVAYDPSTRPLYVTAVSARAASQQVVENRGLFTSSGYAPTQPPTVQQPYVVQYTPPRAASPTAVAEHVQESHAQAVTIPAQGSYSAPVYAQTAVMDAATPCSFCSYPAAPAVTASSASYAYAQSGPYTLDSGDRLRVVVFGQEGLTNSYNVDAGGNINMPLIGTLRVRGITTQQVAQHIAARLKQGYVREPHVSVEIETYRPFFILGEVNNPGQYPYVPNMTAEAAVAIAGGFAPRAYKSTVELTRNAPGQQIHGTVPLGYPVNPGDTIVVKERWF
jgi:polysaccharide export outer membrane protein